MIWWLAGVALFVAIWGSLWRKNLALSFGVLIGLLLAWIAARFLNPYVTGMEEIPIWLPPLPLATIALILFVYGAVVWIRGNDALSDKRQDDTDDQH